MRIKLGYPHLVRHISRAVGGGLVLDENATCLQAVTHLTTDSREVETGDLFIALRGQGDDGHRYAGEAIRRGASCVVSEYTQGDLESGVCHILVKDTWEALAAFARAHASDIPHRTVAITGSVGKTTTRRYLSSLLSEHVHVWESPENYNNLLGSCLTLLSMPRETEVLVAECGMDGAGQISRLSHLLTPDIAVITNIGISHLEKLGTQRRIAEAKLELLDAMPSPCLFAEGSDPYLRELAPFAHFVSASNEACPWHAENIRCDGQGTSFDAVTPSGVYAALRIPTVGIHTLSCAMLALAVADTLGISEEEVRRGLKHYTPASMRQATKQIDRVTLFIDCYNACPASMQAAFHSAALLARASGGRMLALLGDMLELGEDSDTHHRAVGAALFRAGGAHLFCQGAYAPCYAAGAMEAGMPDGSIHLLPIRPDAAGREIAAALSAHDVLLIKGSRGARMEALIPYIEKALDAH